MTAQPETWDTAAVEHSSRPIRYHGTDTEANEGDRVEYRIVLLWPRWKPGIVSHVPGVSEPHPELEPDGMVYLGVTGLDGTFRGIYIDPDTHELRGNLRFIERGGMDGVLRPHDIAPEDW